MPEEACDSHLHIFDLPDRFPYAPTRPYTPAPALVEDMLAFHRALGLRRVVIVQPTLYGSDNACTAEAIRRINAESGIAARGIAVAAPIMDASALKRLHEAGIRGLRLNLVARDASPAEVARRLEAIAALVAPLGWHLQTYAPLSLIAAVRDTIAALPVPLVIDHFGRPRAAEGAGQPGFGELLKLVEAGNVYVKLSAAYRVSGHPDYADAAPLANALIAANPKRMLWGSDWPHIEERKPGSPPRQAGEFEPFREEDSGKALNRLARWAGSAQTLKQILVDNPAQLYGF
jgi:predicted TIM-barrel fold metal-dependent hydrolase